MDYKTERKNQTYIDFETTDESKLFGNHLKQVNIENDKGKNVTVYYYLSGIKKFDDITNSEPFYEYGLSFHLISYENAFVFRLYHDEKEIYVGEFGIWRDAIVNVPTSEICNGKVIVVNRYVQALKSGAFGVGTGLVGMTISVAGGTLISKLIGLKTEETKVQLYNLKYNDDGIINTIKVYKKDNFNSDHYFFIEEHYSNNLNSETIKSTDSRCFVATACYESTNSHELFVFRNFRDKTLLKSTLGIFFVKTYYTFSPYLIKTLNRSMKKTIKTYVLDKIYNLLKNKYGK